MWRVPGDTYPRTEQIIVRVEIIDMQPALEESFAVMKNLCKATSNFRLACRYRSGTVY